jgi:hypothetical protein
VAVAVKVVESRGETTRDPLSATFPMPLSMTSDAVSVVSQVSVVCSPRSMVLGEAARVTVGKGPPARWSRVTSRVREAPGEGVLGGGLFEQAATVRKQKKQKNQLRL